MASDDRCKICLVPLLSLMNYGDNLLSHERDCVKSKISKRACSKGIECQATLPYHYKNFSHDVLSKYLSKCISTVDSKSEQIVCAKRTSTILDYESQQKVNNESKKRKFRSSKTIPKLESHTYHLHSDDPIKPNSKLSTTSTCGDISITSCNFSNQDNELEKITCDVDVNSWSFSDFMDEDTLPLENNDVNQNIFQKSFEHCLNKLNENIGGKSYVQNDQATKNTGDEVEFQVTDSFDEEMCDIIEEINKADSRKPNYQTVEIKNGGPKKQVAITSYFGGKTTLKFVEEKPNAKSPKAKSHTQKTERSVHVNEITSTVTHEPHRRQWPCPFYKKIPGTTFAVDAFCYGNIPGVKHYFLSHFHYDHYRGLNKKFQGNIYCNNITGKLISLKLGIPVASLNILPMEKSTVIDNVEVKLLDANHCPGSVMFLFRPCTGPIVLHTGDFRAHQKMESYPDLLSCKIDQLYLDTTYLDPVYNFPLQEDIIQFVVTLVQQNLSRNPKTLFICGSYTIGKERVFISIAEKLNCKIWVPTEKLRILACIENTSLETRLTKNPNIAQIHVLAMNQLNFKGLQDHLNKFNGIFNTILAIKPTGWEYQVGSTISTLANTRPKSSGSVTIYGIPYSEHSSFNELKKFVKFLHPKKIIPTVGGNPKKRNEMHSILNSWLS